MRKSVSEILLERYGIDARPGIKVACPFCHHKTFSIKSDDLLGKCFHPTCGRYVTQELTNRENDQAIFQVLELFFKDCHKALLELQNINSRNVYRYCVEERKIHPQVVVDSTLGAVPHKYDLDVLFKKCIQETEDKANREEHSNIKPGRPRKKEGQTARERLDSLIECREKLRKCISGHSGWLAFFYTDANHRIVAVRFRKPYEKQITFFKPTKIGGVFNHGLFKPFDVPGLQQLNDHLIVLEGEFNQLQLQSLCVRHAEANSHPPECGYVYACAVGGVNNVDVETISRLSSSPIVCYDHDASGAGFALVENLRKAVTVTAFTTPQPDTDLDDFICSFNNDTGRAFKALKELIAGQKVYNRPFNSLKDEIDDLRILEGCKGGLKRFQVQRQAAEIVIADFGERGCFYNDGRQAYLFLENDKVLIPVESDNQDLELLLSRYGIAPSEDLFRYVLDALRLHALEHGRTTGIHTFTHYCKDTNTLYLFNFKEQICRITTEKIEVVDNGTDGVLFLRNSSWKPFKVDELSTDKSALDEVIISQINFREDGLKPNERRLIFLVWFYSIFFPELFPTKPILAMIGEKGSGKTLALRKVGRLIFGPSFNVMQLSDDSKDFDAAVTNSAFVAVDNSDTKIKWLDDRLAIAATGGSIKKRELYTTNRLIEFPVRAFIGITSRTPRFRREDVADRLLLFYLDHIAHFIPESKLLADLDRRRDEIMSEVACHLQEILQILDKQKNKVYDTPFRMADFANFALKIAHAQGWGHKMVSILERLAGEQSSFVVEDEPIMGLLEKWLALESGKNIGREITSPNLCKELSILADSTNTEFYYSGRTQAFGMRITNLMGTLREFYEIKERRGRSRQRFLSFRPKKEKSQAKQEDIATDESCGD